MSHSLIIILGIIDEWLNGATGELHGQLTAFRSNVEQVHNMQETADHPLLDEIQGWAENTRPGNEGFLDELKDYNSQLEAILNP